MQRSGRETTDKHRARQRDWAAEGVTWAEGHMGICRSHVSLSRGRLWLLPMLYVRFVQEPFRKVSGKRVRKVSRMSGFTKRCHLPWKTQDARERPGGMLPCNSPPQKPSWGANETVFKRMMCDYVFMCFAPSCLPSPAVRVTRIR